MGNQEKYIVKYHITLTMESESTASWKIPPGLSFSAITIFFYNRGNVVFDEDIKIGCGFKGFNSIL